MTAVRGEPAAVRGRAHRLRRALAPLRSVSTVLAGVYLVLGGVVAFAYAELVAVFVQMLGDRTLQRPTVLILAVVAAAMAATPPFLGAVRTLEILAVRTFLGVDLPVPRDAAPPSAATRWRAAAWYGLHITFGAAVTFALLFAVPTAALLVLEAFGAEPSLGVLDVFGRGRDAVSVVVALLLLVVLPYATAGVGALLRQAAVPLLGPDQSERIAELESAARRADERGRLARELHDSVGHALTITTLQAAAAARRLDSDPEAVRRALAAIEETGRTAMADLDHVLGLLRDQAAGTEPPARTLADVPVLVDDTRDAGADVELAPVPAGLDSRVPRAVSREAYRVVQEALTNALRHAPGAPASVRVGLDRRRLDVEVSNASPAAALGPAPGGGRGLDGMAERVRLLGGELTAGPEPASDGDRWVVRARFPLPARGSGA